MMHNLKYTLKILFRDKMLIFWTFAFPIILATLFNMAFSNIEESEKLDIINIAIIENEISEGNKILKESFEILSDEENENRLFETKYVSKEKAVSLLENNEISGYILLEENPKVVITASGINETILKYVTEEVLQSEEIIKNISEYKMKEELGIAEGKMKDTNSLYNKIYEEAIAMVEENNANIKDISNDNLSYTMIEFYTLIAMSCLYGGILSMVAINKNLANMSSNGKRVSISPMSKGKLIFSSVLASYITQLIGITLLFIYTIFLLKVDYGENLPLIVALAVVGSFSGISTGIAVSSLLKTNDNVKTGIMVSFTMFGCFLSGMMGITTKYIVDKNMPIINKLNPANMITDGFYSLYYYNTLDRFYFNLASLSIFAIIMICISMFSLRRQKYDSI